MVRAHALSTVGIVPQSSLGHKVPGFPKHAEHETAKLLRCGYNDQRHDALLTIIILLLLVLPLIQYSVLYGFRVYDRLGLNFRRLCFRCDASTLRKVLYISGPRVTFSPGLYSWGCLIAGSSSETTVYGLLQCPLHTF